MTVREDLIQMLDLARAKVLKLEQDVASLPAELEALDASVLNSVKSWLGLA